VGFVQSDGTQWSVEELVAMEFAYIKQLAENVAGEKVVDAVVTVPPYFSQFERDAIVDSIEIAGLKTLALINDGTAVAVNYALTRTFSKPEHHIIYDAGASGIRATVASFATANDPKSSVAETRINVVGVGYDRSISGTELDRRMRDILIDVFNAKHKRDIRGDKRGMAKLWKEAQRVKAILSANTETVSQVESLAWDIDFKTRVTRAELEAKSEDLKDKFAKPILDALENADLTLVILTVQFASLS
jgi:hypoxia up-regulated 1